MQKIKFHPSPLNKDSSRINLLRACVLSSGKYKITASNTDYQFYLITDAHLKDTNSLKRFERESINVDKKVVFDVSDSSVFDEDVDDPMLTMAIVLADCVICSTAEVQEYIYLTTGRLAYIVEDCFNEFSAFQDVDEMVYSDKEPYVTWIGLKKEIFAVKRDLIQHPTHNISLAFSDQGTKGRSAKQFLSTVRKADIIYIPTELLDEHDYVRCAKIQYAIKQGKFVIAPNFEHSYKDLVFVGSLKDGIEFYESIQDKNTYIKEKQELLKSKHPFAKSFEQFEKALELASLDDYSKDINSWIESQEIKI